MCGIAALFATRGTFPLRAIVAMTEHASHRGPDGEGFLAVSPDGVAEALSGPLTPQAAAARIASARGAADRPCSAALGHRRLSIVDLSAAGHQPMASADGRWWISYNGEIYNHVELRAELERLGHRFGTHSDTEVILAAWERWGRAALDRFNGMFAFVLIDRRERRMIAVRDRFAVKPLYRWASPDGLAAFASEIKQFAALPSWRARLNGQRAYDFLVWGALDHTAETLFEGVEQLRGGELIDAKWENAATARPERWYTLSPRPFAGDLPKAAAGFRELFDSAVALRLRADVNVAVLLSGGLDSSSIAVSAGALRAGAPEAALNAFTLRFGEAAFDEGRYAEAAAERAQARLHATSMTAGEALDEARRLVRFQDEPFGSTSMCGQSRVFAAVRAAGIKVALSGQGADEQLAGYHSFMAPRLAGLLRRGRWAELAREMRAIRTLHGLSFLQQGKLLADTLLPDALRQRLRRAAGRDNVRPAWLDLSALGAQPIDPYESLGDRTADLAERSRLRLTTTNLAKLLHWEDRSSMAHGVESRLPFVDYRLVEYVLGLPEEHKLSRGETKRVLRAAMHDRLPPMVRERRDKMGFVTPERLWLTGGASAPFRAALVEGVERAGGILTPRAIADFDDHAAGRLPFTQRLWRMIAFGLWLESADVAT